MANHRECQFRRIGQIMPNPWDTLRYQPVHGARVDGYEALRGATMGEERGKPSFRRSLVDGRVRMPVGHRRCTRRKVTIGSGCRKLAGFASNGPCWYWVGYRAGRGGISGRSVAAQYDPTLRLYLTPPRTCPIRLSFYLYSSRYSRSVEFRTVAFRRILPTPIFSILR